MNKGISFHFGYIYENVNIEQQVRDIKEAGFDCVIDSADPNFKHQNGGYKKRFKLLKDNGLKFSSLHMRYNSNELPKFWQKGKIGNKLEKNLIKDIKVAYKYGFTCVVVHLRGEWSEVGYNRLNNILKYSSKYNIPLALENLNNNSKLLDKIFKTIKNDYLKFCWDVGHNHAFAPEIDFYSLYKNKLIALHLHDNLGKDVSPEVYEKIGYKSNSPDMHTLNKYGSIDWDDIALKLSKLKNSINLDYEVLMCYRKNETAKEVLQEVYKQACELEKLIVKYKKASK